MILVAELRMIHDNNRNINTLTTRNDAKMTKMKLMMAEKDGL